MKEQSRGRYVFFKDRPEWADVTPVPQDDGERNIVKIAYSPQSIDANDYLRAVLLKDERSERALTVTTTVLLLNPANYTVWEYRRRILETISSDLNAELEFVSQLIDEHSKNYQLWHHRQWIVTKLSAQTSSGKEIDQQQWGFNELDFTDSIISDDSKNYHAWQHRRWVVTHFKMPPDGELRYTEVLIQSDMYNNSAWNHRFVTVTKDEGLTPAVLDREVKFTQRMIRMAPNNESAWNYLYGLLVPMPDAVFESTQSSTVQDLPGFSTHVTNVDETGLPTVPVSSEFPRMNLKLMRQFAEDLANSDTVASNSPALLGFLVEVYTDCLQIRIREEQLKKQGPNQSACQTGRKSSEARDTNCQGVTEESPSELLELALSTCDRLATEVDRIRANYWHYRARQLVAISKNAGLEE